MYLSNFLKTIELNEIFIDKDNYFAHKDAKNNSYKETIFEHSINTLVVADYFLKRNNYKIINNITNLFLENYNKYNDHKNLIKSFKIQGEFQREEVFNFFINTLYLSILMHDNGKHNPFYQQDKMDNNIKNNDFFKNHNINECDKDSNHSKYSNFSYFVKKYTLIENLKIEKLDNFNKYIKEPYCNMLLLNIEKHHSGLDNISNNEISNLKNINYLFNNELNIIFDIFYSILVQSDILSTSYYMLEQTNKLDYDNIDLLVSTFKNYLDNKLVQINYEEIKTLETKKPYNKYLYANIKQFNEEDILNTNTLNELKYKVASNIIASKNIDDIRIFNGNTGIGKTNISMIYINELIKNNNISKVIYSLPLNILINQTYYELLDTFEFNQNKINIVNSENTISKNDKQENKQNYWNLKYDFDNFNNEIVLTSTINFFHKLFHKDKKSKLSLINLENSLLILDEIQLIDDRFFELIYKYLLMLNKYLNIKILILSATLPIPKIFENDFSNKSILNENLNQTILNHSLFERYKYDLSMFDKNGKDISDYINNSKNENNFLIVHNSIRKCNELFNSMNLNKDIEVYFYNNTIMKPILSSILEKIRKNTTKKIVVISTMKIETGVDISFDVGFKFSSTIDSITQFAGRINRYGERENSSKVFIIKDSNIKLYGKNQKRDELAKDNTYNESFFNKHLKNIKEYYNLLFENSNSKSLKDFENINFEELNKIKLIDNDTILKSFYVHVEDVSLILSKKDFELYKKYFKTNDNKNLLLEYKKTFFYINKDIKYLFSLFTFSGYVSNNSNFNKDLDKNVNNLFKIENENTKEIIEIYYLINKENFYYDLEKGLNINKQIDIDDLEDLINSI